MDDASTTPPVTARPPPVDAVRPDFDAFFRAYFARVARAMMLAVHDRDLGEQIAQEAFTRVFERWSAIESEEHAVGFVYRTGLNLAASHHRRERGWSVLTVSRRAELTPGATRGHEDDVANRLGVLSALRQLSPKQRASVLLVDYAGFDVHAAGRILGVAPATIRVHLSRGRRALRRALGAPDEETET